MENPSAEEICDSSPSSSVWEEVMGKAVLVMKLKSENKGAAPMGTIVTCNIKTFFLVNEAATDVPELDKRKVELSPFETALNKRFMIGEGDATPALEVTLRHAGIGDTFRVRCAHRFAFGHEGRQQLKQPSLTKGGKDVIVPAIPPNTDLEFEVTVLDHFNEDNDGVDDPDPDALRKRVLASVLFRKECGNRWYSYGDCVRAGRAYSKAAEMALKYLQNSSVEEGGDDDESGGVKDENETKVASKEEIVPGKTSTVRISRSAEADDPVVEVYVACLNNLAACHITLSDFLKAKEACIKVLEFSPQNVKALLRAARAALALHEYEECRLCLDRVREVEPANKVAASERIRLRLAEKKYRESEKEMSKRMTKKLFPDKEKKNDEPPPEKKTSANIAADADAGEVVKADEVQSGNTAAIPERAAPKEESTIADTTQPSSSADTTSSRISTPPASHSSLLLLLLTSLLVLLVSVGLAVGLGRVRRLQAE